MKRQRSLLVMTVVVVWLVVLAGCAPAGPGPEPASGSLSPNLLSGLAEGLETGDGAHMRVERLVAPGLESPGETVRTFDVTNGDWRQAGLDLAPGRYRLIPEAQGYVQIPHSIVFEVPEQDLAWRYTRLDFQFLRPEDAPARVGLPLCGEAGGPVPVSPVPDASPLAPYDSTAGQPGSPPPQSGLCYANHLATASQIPAGLEGEIRGLDADERATLRLYALSRTGAALEDSPEAATLDAMAEIGLDVAPAVELAVDNGRWGLVDPSLVGGKYLVVAFAAGYVTSPPGYEVAIVGGKAPGFPGGVDFAFAPEP